jgi:hypothetical protein
LLSVYSAGAENGWELRKVGLAGMLTVEPFAWYLARDGHP